MKNIGWAGVSSQAGPVAQHRAERDHIGLPASTASFVFFSESFANCVRLGLLMSAIRNVGCPPTLLDRRLRRGECGPAAVAKLEYLFGWVGPVGSDQLKGDAKCHRCVCE